MKAKAPEKEPVKETIRETIKEPVKESSRETTGKNAPVYNGKEAFVFISYSHRNQDKVEAIKKEFAKRRIRFWYDQGISKGSSWSDIIAERIEECAVVLSLVSKDSVASRDCDQELSYAIELKKTLYPCYLDATRPKRGHRLYFAGRQAIHAEHMSADELASELGKAVIFQDCIEA